MIISRFGNSLSYVRYINESELAACGRSWPCHHDDTTALFFFKSFTNFKGQKNKREYPTTFRNLIKQGNNHTMR